MKWPITMATNTDEIVVIWDLGLKQAIVYHLLQVVCAQGLWNQPTVTQSKTKMTSHKIQSRIKKSFYRAQPHKLDSFQTPWIHHLVKGIYCPNHHRISLEVDERWSNHNATSDTISWRRRAMSIAWNLCSSTELDLWMLDCQTSLMFSLSVHMFILLCCYWYTQRIWTEAQRPWTEYV